MSREKKRVTLDDLHAELQRIGRESKEGYAMDAGKAAEIACRNLGIPVIPRLADLAKEKP